MVLKNKYGEVRSGWSLAILIAIYFLVQIFVGILMGIVAVIIAVSSGTPMNDMDLFRQKIEEIATSSWLENMMYYLVTLFMMGASWLLFRLLYKRPLAQMGLERTGWLRQLLYGCLFGMVSISVVAALLFLTGMGTITPAEGGQLATMKYVGEFCGGIVLFILVGFNEEIMTRGFMMTALKTTRVKWLILLLPALLFALLHITNPHVTVLALLNIMLVGILFGYLFIKTGRIWAPIGFHIAWNFFQGYIYGMAVSGMESSSLLQTSGVGPAWVTGDAFGAEGGVLCTVVLLLGMVFVRFFVKGSEGAYWSMTSDLPLTRERTAAERGLEPRP